MEDNKDKCVQYGVFKSFILSKNQKCPTAQSSTPAAGPMTTVTQHWHSTAGPLCFSSGHWLLQVKQASWTNHLIAGINMALNIQNRNQIYIYDNLKNGLVLVFFKSTFIPQHWKKTGFRKEKVHRVYTSMLKLEPHAGQLKNTQLIIVLCLNIYNYINISIFLSFQSNSNVTFS